jgi:hypothetical protein
LDQSLVAFAYELGQEPGWAAPRRQQGFDKIEQRNCDKFGVMSEDGARMNERAERK